MGIKSHVFSLTNKRALIWGALFSLFALGGYVTILAISSYKTAQRAETIIAHQNETIGQNQLLEDGDGDGLKSWEEIIWKTDPQNPDTDGDGVSDGNEIEQGKDPLVKGGGDPNRTPLTQEIKTVEGGLTEELAKAVIESGALKNALDKNPSELPTSYLKNVGATYQSSGQELVSQGTKELRYSPAGDHKAIKNYFNAVAAIYTKHFDSQEKSEFQAFEEIVNNYRKSENEALLKNYLAAAESSWNEYKLLAAPLAVKSFHERGAELALKTISELRALDNFEKDPAMTILALQGRLQTKIGIGRMYGEEIKQWIESQKIAFTENDAARRFFNW